jgi:hypothetical protein
VETRHQRAKTDARSSAVSRRELIFPLVSGVIALVVSLATGGPLPAIIALGAIAVAALLVPAGTYIGSWVTAPVRILTEEVGVLRGEQTSLRQALQDLDPPAPPVAPLIVPSKPDTPQIATLRYEFGIGELLLQRCPPGQPQLNPIGQIEVPEDLRTDIRDWQLRIATALESEPDLRRQFVGEVAIETGLLAQYPITQVMRQRLRMLASIIANLKRAQ